MCQTILAHILNADFFFFFYNLFKDHMFRCPLNDSQ